MCIAAVLITLLASNTLLTNHYGETAYMLNRNGLRLMINTFTWTIESITIPCKSTKIVVNQDFEENSGYENVVGLVGGHAAWHQTHPVHSITSLLFLQQIWFKGSLCEDQTWD